MDIAGYNCGILRYRYDLKKYPQRLILGRETVSPRHLLPVHRLV